MFQGSATKNEYLALYYHSDDDVARDHELQDFSKQLAGGFDGGAGRVPGFPSTVDTRDQYARSCAVSFGLRDRNMRPSTIRSLNTRCSFRICRPPRMGRRSMDPSTPKRYSPRFLRGQRQRPKYKSRASPVIITTGCYNTIYVAPTNPKPSSKSFSLDFGRKCSRLSRHGTRSA
jgi:hypothetical protein